MSFWEFLSRRRDDVLELGFQHIRLVLVALVIATLIGLALGALTYERPRAAAAVLGITGVFLTIPSIALFGLLIPVLGLGFRPAVVALVLYALLPIVRNTITGLRGVDAAVVDSARGMGMSRLEILRRVEMPLAWPVVLAGVRVSALLLVGIAAIAAIVNGPGLGEFIFSGLARIGGANAVNLALLGTLGVVVVAILFDLFFTVLTRLTTSRGIRD